MAELIPVEYRIQAARQALVSRWMAIGVLAAIVAGVGLSATYVWRARQAGTLAQLERDYQAKAVLITQAKALQERRLSLAGQMQKLQSLENDNTLLSLLGDISRAFTDRDCLQFVQVQAHAPQDSGKSDASYFVRIRGITADDTTHSNLLERLTAIGKKSDPPIAVPMGEKQLRPVQEGSVTVFDLTCSDPQAKGT